MDVSIIGTGMRYNIGLSGELMRLSGKFYWRGSMPCQLAALPAMADTFAAPLVCAVGRHPRSNQRLNQALIKHRRRVELCRKPWIVHDGH